MQVQIAFNCFLWLNLCRKTVTSVLHVKNSKKAAHEIGNAASIGFVVNVLAELLFIRIVIDEIGHYFDIFYKGKDEYVECGRNCKEKKS